MADVYGATNRRDKARNLVYTANKLESRLSNITYGNTASDLERIDVRLSTDESDFKSAFERFSRSIQNVTSEIVNSFRSQYVKLIQDCTENAKNKLNTLADYKKSAYEFIEKYPLAIAKLESDDCLDCFGTLANLLKFWADLDPEEKENDLPYVRVYKTMLYALGEYLKNRVRVMDCDSVLSAFASILDLLEDYPEEKKYSEQKWKEYSLRKIENCTFKVKQLLSDGKIDDVFSLCTDSIETDKKYGDNDTRNSAEYKEVFETWTNALNSLSLRASQNFELKELAMLLEKSFLSPRKDIFTLPFIRDFKPKYGLGRCSATIGIFEFAKENLSSYNQTKVNEEIIYLAGIINQPSSYGITKANDVEMCEFLWAECYVANLLRFEKPNFGVLESDLLKNKYHVLAPKVLKALENTKQAFAQSLLFDFLKGYFDRTKLSALDVESFLILSKLYIDCTKTKFGVREKEKKQSKYTKDGIFTQERIYFYTVALFKNSTALKQISSFDEAERQEFFQAYCYSYKYLFGTVPKKNPIKKKTAKTIKPVDVSKAVLVSDERRKKKILAIVLPSIFALLAIAGGLIWYFLFFLGL